MGGGGGGGEFLHNLQSMCPILLEWEKVQD